ncbi:MAG: cysteine desulfurase, partial [Nitrosopumilales archaeon CG15_BIG_FIL_POST_REV_8_21_14_020_33_23]
MQSVQTTFENLRKDFPILQRIVRDNKTLVYLDNASTTQKPNQVIDAITDYYRNHNANIHRAVYALAEEATELYEATRDKIANFIHIQNREEIIFVRGTTEAINLVAYAWGRNHISKDDIIVTTEYEHHSNIVPWQLLTQEKGAKLVYIGMGDNGELILDDLDRYLATGKVKLVTFSLMSNVLGTITDAEKIISKCKEHGVLTLV